MFSLTSVAKRGLRPVLAGTRSYSSGGASTLILADQAEGKLHPSTLNALTAAKAIGGDVTILVTGDGDHAKSAGEAAAKLDGVSKVAVASDPALKNGLAENVAGVVLAAQKQYGSTHVISAASTLGKGVLPRVAAALDVSPISEITEVKSADTFVRPIYAGNALATVQSSDAVKVITVRPTAFEAAGEGGSASSEDVAVSAADAGLSTWKSSAVSQSDKPDLGTASVVVSGGRGMKNGENFAMLDTLADKLGGAVGASRAAVDAGFVPNDLQVGQTGKVVAPELYIAVGISGAIQHLAGMKDSKTIACINKDPEAPIFQVSDYGLVDDLFKAVPELTEKL